MPPSAVPHPGSLAGLPTPVDRPAADVVIFDGDCRICMAQMRRLERWDRGGQLAFVSLHDPQIRLRYPDLEHSELMRNLVVVDRRGGRHHGADAFAYLTRRLPWLWWLAAPLNLPGTAPLWRWLYGHVAARRYLFGRANKCDDGSCAVPR